MTPEAFRAELSRLNLTQLAAARFLEVDPRTVRRWAAGDLTIPKSVEMLLARLNPADVESVRVNRGPKPGHKKAPSTAKAEGE